MKKTRAKLVGVFLFLIVSLSIYTIYDNNRVTIVEQEVVIEDLPKELVGFSILQVSDLHEKSFGENQEKLIEKINSLSYDAIVFTGDMLKRPTSTNYQPFYQLLDGIQHKENAWFVPGNTDPEGYHSKSKQSFQKTDFIKGMEQRGIKLLEALATLQKGQAKVHFAYFDFIFEQADPALSSKDLSEEYLNHLQRLREEVSCHVIIEESDLFIGLTHYPVVDQRIDSLLFEENQKVTVRDIDILLAGHYHGGQIRIPLLGALFIPEVGYGTNGFFPPQDRVKGLWDYRELNQYVSTGLGSSDAIKLLNFRLFNTPEINLIVLKSRK